VQKTGFKLTEMSVTASELIYVKAYCHLDYIFFGKIQMYRTVIFSIRPNTNIQLFSVDEYEY